MRLLLAVAVLLSFSADAAVVSPTQSTCQVDNLFTFIAEDGEDGVHVDVTGPCRGRSAYGSTDVATPISVGSLNNKLSGDYCISFVASTLAGNTNPLLRFVNGTGTEIGSITTTDTGVTFTLRGETATFTTKTLLFNHFQLCVDSNGVTLYEGNNCDACQASVTFSNAVLTNDITIYMLADRTGANNFRGLVASLYVISCSGPRVTHADIAALQCRSISPNCTLASPVIIPIEVVVAAYLADLNAGIPTTDTPTVQGPPGAEGRPGPRGNVTISGGISLTENSDPSFTLTCISTGGPATTVTWTRDSTILTEGTGTMLNDPVTATYTHTLVATQCGEYSCSVANNKPSSDTACGVVDGLNLSTILTSLDPAPIIILPINATAVKISWTSFCVPLKFHYSSICNLTGVVITQKTEVLPIGVNTMNITLDDEFDGYEHRFSLQHITYCDQVHTTVIEEDFTFDKQHFQIQFGPIDYCLSWEVDGKLASIEAQIQSRLIRVIRENCTKCFDLTTSFLRKGAFLCRGNPLSATYRSTLVNPLSNTTAANLVGIIQNWVSTRPAMILDGVIVMVNGTCPTAISTLDEEECDGGGHVDPALSQRITQTMNVCAIRELGAQTICRV